MPDPKVSPVPNQPQKRDATLRNAEFDWGDTYRSTSPLPLKHRIPKRPRPSGKANTPSQNRPAGGSLSPATQVIEKPAEVKAIPSANSENISPQFVDGQSELKHVSMETEQLLPISGTIRTISPIQAKKEAASVPVQEPIPATVEAEVIPEPTSEPVSKLEPFVVPAIAPVIEAVPEPVEEVITEPAPLPVQAAPTEPEPVVATEVVESIPVVEVESQKIKTASTSLKLEEQPGLAAVKSVSEPIIEEEPVEPAPSAPLYYKNTPLPDRSQPKQSTSLSKPQPQPTMKSSSPYSSSSSSSAIKSVGSGTPGGTPRNPGIADYKSNMERQSREQKSVGGILSIIVYSLVGCLLIGGGLAGYGLYVLKEQIAGQSVTIGDLERNFSAKTDALQKTLDSTTETLNQALSQMNRQNDMIVQQEDQINKLIKADQDQTAALTTANTSINTEAAAISRERALRFSAVEDIRDRLHHLENRVSELHTTENHSVTKTDKTDKADSHVNP